MEVQIKFKSIGMRWFANVFSVVSVVIVATVILFCIFINSVYIERVRSLASEYAQSFSPLSTVSLENFADTAREYAENFEHKDKIEVQIIDARGNVIVTTNGFEPSVKNDIPDYESAKKNMRGIAHWQGKSSEGEPIIAETTLLSSFDEESIGAVRWVVSLRQTNKQIWTVCIFVIFVAFCFLSVTAFMGVYFIKSIAKPIREVSNLARKIAMGDFNSKIEFNRVDEIGELCDAVNYMASELEQADKLKNDFISSVSHELRTPLTAIRGWGETAKFSIGSDDGLVEKGLDVVLSESDRLSSLVEELLDFSRMQSGRLNLNNTGVINVTKLCQTAADMYIELARQQNVELTFITPKTECEIIGDADKLKQVFINVIDNAVKYTEAGGQVLVEQYIEEACVRIVVKDTGVGIPAADLDHVKEKFFKSNKTVRGSGIGLAVADEIVKQHEGLLFVESVEGVGTTVTVVLPLKEPEQEVSVINIPPNDIQENTEGNS